jgi:two-component system sensor histidine kinase KdpD
VNEEARPDPDLLLRRLQAAEARQKRAKLKVFFGFAPGVGKTYAMLRSAHRLAAEGVEVVVGYVETHQRAETAALLAGLEPLPRRAVDHRGAHLEEFDLDLALARKPRVLLLDELAHTNAPGVRHKKRWQDVLDLLDAGIDVHTTLNVQHVESLNDVVAQVTQVRVRETVPDAILDRADEIELIDLPLDALLVRLKEGKVYLGEQASQAAQHFFKRGNLLALRELALRRTADRVDADMLAYREEHAIEATSRRPGPRPSGSWCAWGRAPPRRGWCGPRGAWPRACAPPGSRPASRSMAPPRCPRARRRASTRTSRWPSPSAARSPG